MKVMASDADDPTYGSSARIVYSVLDGENFFTVDRQTGKTETFSVFRMYGSCYSIFLLNFICHICFFFPFYKARSTVIQPTECLSFSPLFSQCALEGTLAIKCPKNISKYLHSYFLAFVINIRTELPPFFKSGFSNSDQHQQPFHSISL